MNEQNNPYINREILKNHLQKLEQEIQTKEIKSRISRKRLGTVCSIVFLGVLCTCFFFRNFQDERLFLQYYEPYPNVVSFLERGETRVENKTQAFQLYEQGHYDEALELFEESYTPNHTPSDILFYAGISCIETKKLEKAQNYLSMALQQTDSTFATQANWYMALIYLKENERKKARQYLIKLTQRPDIYNEKATQLLNDL